MMTPTPLGRSSSKLGIRVTAMPAGAVLHGDKAAPGALSMIPLQKIM